MQTHHHMAPPTHHTSLTQLVKVSVWSVVMYRVTSLIQQMTPPTPHHTPHHLPAVSEGPVQCRVSWLLKATVHRQPSQADCQSGPGPQGKERGRQVTDLIQQKKTPLTKDQITVLASGATASTVLIEGAPGIGKTTLLWQLCHQWADGKLLKSWDLVILVQLRDETTRTAQCLSDLLYHPRKNIREAICREIEEREGENVLLIFDGYDELSDDQRTDSIFIRLLRRQSHSLRKATVVVSSRPFATKTLPHQFKNCLDQHVEIVGFNEQDIETYLTSACENNPDLLRDLKSYISTQAFISSVLYNPLHCTIVTELYLQYWQRGEKGFAPSTLTQLYEALVLNLLRRHLCLGMTPSWLDLPSDVSHQLNQLGELAARGIEQRKYIFDNVPSDTLGLMHSVKPLHNYRPNHPISHSFTHLTLQEFLAGRYWSQLPHQQLTELLQRHDLFPIQQYLKGMQLEEDEESVRVTHWPVLLFLAGLTTIPTELITAWTDQDDTNSESSTSGIVKEFYCIYKREASRTITRSMFSITHFKVPRLFYHIVSVSQRQTASSSSSMTLYDRP